MFHVLSFDPQRVRVCPSSDGKVSVSKQTSAKEYLNITLATKHLEKYEASINRGSTTLKVRVVPITSWDESAGILSTTFCKGENLEKILREVQGDARKAWLYDIRNLFLKFQKIGFLWGDFAPRNIIWDNAEDMLWLVDFERDLILRNCRINQNQFNRYVRSYSREEFSSFLMRDEQAILFDGLLDESSLVHIPVEHITSKRKKGLLESLFGRKPSFSSQEIREVEDLMIFVATPFLVRDNPFFPMDALDIISSTRGHSEYINTVLTIKTLDEPSRFSELVRISCSF